MSFYKVPVNNGVLDINYMDFLAGIQSSPHEYCVKLKEGALVRESWQEISEAEWLSMQPPMPEPAEPAETTDQKLARLEQQNLVLMGALADLYEEILALKEGGGVGV